MEFQVLVLISSRLEVTLLPEISEKVRLIVDRKADDPLLVSPTRAYQQIPPGSQWTDYDTNGMDDCFPNIEPGLSGMRIDLPQDKRLLALPISLRFSRASHAKFPS